MDDDLLTIGAFAAATGLTIPALRHYDEIDLLKPARVDPGSGYRRYRRDQLDEARIICGLRAIGMPIDEVRTLTGRASDEMRSALEGHRERLVAQVRELTQRIAAVDEFAGKGTFLPEPRLTRPVQLWVQVRDVRKAAAFYTAAFDAVFNEAISSLQFGTYRTDLFFLVTLEEQDEPSPVRFGLLVGDVEAAHVRAVEAGGVEVHPPVDFPWKPRSSCVRDADGNLIDLSQG